MTAKANAKNVLGKSASKQRKSNKSFAKQTGANVVSVICHVPHIHTNECDCHGDVRVRNRSNAKD